MGVGRERFENSLPCHPLLQSAFRKSFGSEWDFKARFANHLIQNGTSNAFRESFGSERDFKARFANHLIQNGTSKHIS